MKKLHIRNQSLLELNIRNSQNFHNMHWKLTSESIVSPSFTSRKFFYRKSRSVILSTRSQHPRPSLSEANIQDLLYWKSTFGYSLFRIWQSFFSTVVRVFPHPYLNFCKTKTLNIFSISWIKPKWQQIASNSMDLVSNYSFNNMQLRKKRTQTRKQKEVSCGG